MTPDFIDFLGNPVAVGDLYLHPVSHGSSSAYLNFGKVEEIIPIVKLNNGIREIWTLQEYVGRRNPTEYHPSGTWIKTGPLYSDRRWEPKPGRSYVIRARSLDRRHVARDTEAGVAAWRWSDGKRGRVVKNVDRLVVVTHNIAQPWIDRVAEADSLGFGAE